MVTAITDSTTLTTDKEEHGAAAMDEDTEGEAGAVEVVEADHLALGAKTSGCTTLGNKKIQAERRGQF